MNKAELFEKVDSTWLSAKRKQELKAAVEEYTEALIAAKPRVRRSVFWVFSHYIDGIPVFERSTPCEDRAKERVKELRDWYGYTEAFYSTELPKKYFA